MIIIFMSASVYEVNLYNIVLMGKLFNFIKMAIFYIYFICAFFSFIEQIVIPISPFYD